MSMFIGIPPSWDIAISKGNLILIDEFWYNNVSNVCSLRDITSFFAFKESAISKILFICSFEKSSELIRFNQSPVPNIEPKPIFALSCSFSM